MNPTPKPRGGTTGPGAARPKSARRRSRELALQGLYEWQISRAETSVVRSHMREQDEFSKCDSAMFDALLQGCIEQAPALDGLLTPHLDRPIAELSPIEHGVLLIGLYELQHCVDVPYRVAINEAVELAKSFGGTDGHKYVNGVLDKAAVDLRPVEVAAQRLARSAPRGE
ncbi:transcription antitermination factor NusB [uncultured Sphaerotilus sp.]|uniref:transcription antitermination factor NusB n=1 Tax=uncultured Sphaerotilus sp. TaxID=474984 RepID=UPI0030CA2F6E